VIDTAKQEPGGDAVLSRPLLWWDLAAGLMLAALCILGALMALDDAPIWAAGAPLGSRLVLVLLPLAAFTLLWMPLGRPSLRRAMRDEAILPRGRVLLGILVVLLAYAVFTVPMFALAQALAYPIAWTLSHRYLEALLWSAAISAATGVGMFLGIASEGTEGAVGSALASALISALLSFVFAVAMGTWITRISMQGERHRELAEQLERSRAEVVALSEEAGAAAERERLSRDLHDTLTQTLTGLVMLSEQAERALEADDRDRARDRLSRVGSAAREAVAEARALVATTQPLGDGGLAASIERIAARMGADTGLRVECSLTPVPLDREREVVLLRAAQEGLANTRKHARAREARVSLEALPEGGARLAVEDDGIGPVAAGPAGFGLSGLAERVRAVGGEVDFGPGAVRGSRLEVRLPARTPAARDDRGGAP
jgi:signal transduction histidine kinase